MGWPWGVSRGVRAAPEGRKVSPLLGCLVKWITVMGTASVTTTGASVSTIGASVATIGASVSTIGASVTTTGASVSTTGAFVT